MRVRRSGKVRGGKLTGQQKLELIVGPLYRNSTLPSPEETQAAWFAHRDELSRMTNTGTRCWAWWRFEYEGKAQSDLGTEGLVALIECGELTDGEAAKLKGWGGNQWPPEAEAAWQARLSREGATDG